MVSARTWRRSIAAAALFLPLAMVAAPVASADDGGSSSSSSTPATGYPNTAPSTLAGIVSNPVCDGDVPYLSYDIDVDGDTSATSFDLTWTSLDGQHKTTETTIPGTFTTVNGERHFIGKILWLGASESGGQATGWPGWVYKNGTWNVGGQYTWVRPNANVTFTAHDSSYGKTAATGDVSYSDGVYVPGEAAISSAALALPATNILTTGVSYPVATKACANPAGETPPPGGSSSSSPTSTTVVAGLTVTHHNDLAITGMNVLPFVAAALVLLLIGGVLVLVSRRHRKAPQTY
jgi:hypothetical protein